MVPIQFQELSFESLFVVAATFQVSIDLSRALPICGTHSRNSFKHTTLSISSLTSMIIAQVDALR